MPEREISDLASLVSSIENALRDALDKEEKRLIQEKTLLIDLYEQVVGDFKEKTASDLAVAYTVSLVKDLAPDLYAIIDVE
jgi:hypothetical protein